MKKLATVGFLGLCLGIGLVWCPPAGAADNVRFYLGAEGVFSFTQLWAGGYNGSGGFENTGSDLNKVLRPGAHLGLAFSDVVNFDLGFHHRGGFHFTTPSFIWGPVYHYDTDVNAYSLMFSVFIAPLPSYVISPYLGFGAGGTKITMSTDDTVVNGTVDKINFTWQIEAGFHFAPTANFALRIGYRYLRLGKSELDLFDLGVPAGNFTGTIAGHEIILGFRVTL